MADSFGAAFSSEQAISICVISFRPIANSFRLALAHTKSLTLPTYGYYYRNTSPRRRSPPRYRNRDSISREHLRQALEFARLTSTPGEQRATFLCWHAFEGAKLISRSLRSGKLGDVIASVPSLCRDDLLWPWRLFRPLRLCNQVMRSTETRPTNSARCRNLCR